MNNTEDRYSPYYKQVSLLMRCLPHVAKEQSFALKGGAAINVFVNIHVIFSASIHFIKSEGISRDLFIGFLAYLLSQNRPLSEVLNPRWKDTTDTFNNEFIGMTFDTISLDELRKVPRPMV